MTQPVICLEGVRRDYPGFTLGEINLTLEGGRVLGLIGPNGAGKSTLLRILMGLVRVSAGRVRVLGREMPAGAAAVKREVGFVSEDMGLHPGATVAWHAALARRFYEDWDEARARGLLARFRLRADEKAGALSRGETVKTMFLLALARRPRLLILDEPTAGLDPLARGEILEEIGRLVREEGMSVVISSHLTEDLETLADEIAFLYEGRLVEAGPCDRFVASAGSLERSFRERVREVMS